MNIGGKFVDVRDFFTPIPGVWKKFRCRCGARCGPSARTMHLKRYHFEELGIERPEYIRAKPIRKVDQEDLVRFYNSLEVRGTTLEAKR